MKQGRSWLLLLPVLLALFTVGIARLFQLRFEAGDVYPPYSSLRADPLGTKVLYKSLQNLNGVASHRFTQPLEKLPDGRGLTLFVFGADASQMDDSPREEYQKLEQFMFGGGRVVVSFAPVNTKPWAPHRDETKEKEESTNHEPKKSAEPKPDKSARVKPPVNDDESGPGRKRIPLTERWNVGLAYKDLPKDARDVFQPVVARRAADVQLPESLRWHTALYFDEAGANWRVIYERDRHPVLIERAFGHGSLVFSADSFFVSNEAMRADRQPEVLAWLVGPNASVLFDETHLGVAEAPGVAALVRKYHLHALVIGFVSLAGLFVWKSSVPFVRAHDEQEAGFHRDAVAGKDSAAGFVHLLRRSISPSEILPVCFAEWKKARACGRTDLKAKMERAAAVIAEEQTKPARERSPLESYRRISRILSERSEFLVPSQQSQTDKERGSD
jgi:hypothetical protein